MNTKLYAQIRNQNYNNNQKLLTLVLYDVRKYIGKYNNNSARNDDAAQLITVICCAVNHIR